MTRKIIVETEIDFSGIVDLAGFHAASRRAFGFPDFYGNNMHAWIDCVRSLRLPAEGLSTLTLDPDQFLSLRLTGFEAFLAGNQTDGTAILLSIGVVNDHCCRVDGAPLILPVVT